MAGLANITHFAGLRSKTYALKAKGLKAKGRDIAKCKGIPKSAKRKLTFSKFKKCLDQITEEHVTFFNMRSINHTIYTQHIKKRALCTFDE